MAVDPVRVTDYNRTEEQLQELLLFCSAVAGKNATRTAIMLEKLLQYGRDHYDCNRHFREGTPFQIIKALDDCENLPNLMKNLGFGCFNIKSRSFIEIAESGLDLRACTVNDLEALFGVGMKTARYFVLHTRKNARVACLDTHILAWLSYYSGHEVPKQTPTKKKYLELEKVFLSICDAMKIAPADLDLKIWNKQRGSDEQSLEAHGKQSRNIVRSVQ